jgi:hypothetical protein
MGGKCGCSRLSPIPLGFAVGLTCGLFMMALAWIAWIWGFGAMLVQQEAAIFPGFEASLNGGFYGLGWGILQGFIFGLVLGIIYNILMCCRSCCCCSAKSAKQ